MKNIKLFGNIADDYKAEWLLNVQTPSEALRAINANRPGFLAECDAGNYVVLLVDESDADNVKQVTDKNGLGAWGDEVLYVVPKMSGDVAAIALAAVAAVGATGIAATIVYAVVYVIVYVAIAIAVQQIASLISGTPDGFGANDTEAVENKASYLFNGVVNTAKQGRRLPVLYGGPMLVGSMVLSSRVNTKDSPV